jgi:hypothetical protein
MLHDFYKWNELLKADNGRPSLELETFEKNMIDLHGSKILDQWVRWSEKLQRLGLYK